MNNDSIAVAHELNEWFQSVQRLADDSLFSIAPQGPHRDAVILDALRRNAKIAYNARLNGDGKLYSPLCFFLAAACRYLRASLGDGHWRAAIDNLRDLQQRLARSRPESVAIGLDLGTPATLFKSEFDEAARQAGLVDDTSFLSKDDRQVAIGLAINLGNAAPARLRIGDTSAGAAFRKKGPRMVGGSTESRLSRLSIMLQVRGVEPSEPTSYTRTLLPIKFCSRLWL